MKFKSIRFRISVFYTCILGIILLLYSSIIYFGLRYTLYSNLDRELVVKAQEISNAISSYLDVTGYDYRSLMFAANRVIRQEGSYFDQNKVGEIENKWLQTRDRLGLRYDYINFGGIKGGTVVSSTNMSLTMLSYFLKSMATPQDKAIFYRDLNFDNNKLRLINIPYYYKNKRLYFIQVGVSRTPISRILYGGLFFMLFTIPVILVITSFIGAALADRILKPVMEVAGIARNITHKDLSVRVKSEHADEELEYLVGAFNEMISRLDKSFRYITEFSSNVAHELKTPLTIIRGEAELAFMKERDTQEYKRVIEVNLEEAERMIRIVEDLLLLSKLEYQPEGFKFEKLNFSELIRKIYEQTKKLSEQKKIEVVLIVSDKPIAISADKLHLTRLFVNLLNNAIKFTPENGKINIIVKTDKDEVMVSIADTGMGILPKDLPRIFDRFFHVDRTGKDNETGSGLGLSIVQSIARIHQGAIDVESKPGAGSIFTVTLPTI